MSNQDKNFRGVYVATVTPMTEKSEVDYNNLASFTDGLIDSGVDGLIPLGSTGEFYALTPDERHDVLKGTIEAAGGRVPDPGARSRAGYAGARRRVRARSPRPRLGRARDRRARDRHQPAIRRHRLPGSSGRGHVRAPRRPPNGIRR